MTKKWLREMVLFCIFITELTRNEGQQTYGKKSQAKLFLFVLKKKNTILILFLKKQVCILMTGTDGIDFMCELMRKREQTEHG